VGFACAAAAIALRWLLDLIAPDMVPYPFVYPAVLLATLIAGGRGGLVALVVGMLATDYFFVPPRFTLAPHDPTHAASLVITTFAILLVLLLATRYRSAVLARAQERKETEEHLRFLMSEVDHRGKNLLAVVQSVVSLTRADGAEAARFQRDVRGRIHALSRVHKLLANTRWQGADLGTLIEDELRPYGLEDLGRVRVSGPRLSLDPAEAQAVAMAIHELATNAAKYGALSLPTGRLDVSWVRDGSGARSILWQEDGGPPVVQSDSQGLGMRLLAQVLAGTGGRTQLEWPPGGLVCRLHLPPETPAIAAPGSTVHRVQPGADHAVLLS
jgi:two-component sensor histidine kinase